MDRLPLLQGGVILLSMVMGGAAWEALQSVDLLDGITGSVLDATLTVLVLIVVGRMVKWVFDLSKNQEERLLSLIEAKTNEAKHWHSLYMEAEQRYQTEHELRLSLEAKGIADRRRHGEPDE